MEIEKEVVGKILITEEEINARAKEIGEQISKDFAGESVVLVGILRGAILWMTEVAKRISLTTTFDFMRVSSYGSSTKSSGVVKIEKDLDSDITDQNVIIMEDIVDSGVTLSYLKKYLAARNPKSITICSLLNKEAGRKVDLKAEYVGFEVDDRFIIGYGLDYKQKYRNLPYISYIEGTEMERFLEKQKKEEENGKA